MDCLSAEFQRLLALPLSSDCFGGLSCSGVRTHQISVSTIDNGGRVHTSPLLTRPLSEDRLSAAPFNRAYLCLDATGRFVTPEIVNFLPGCARNVFEEGSSSGSALRVCDDVWRSFESMNDNGFCLEPGGSGAHIGDGYNLSVTQQLPSNDFVYGDELRSLQSGYSDRGRSAASASCSGGLCSSADVSCSEDDEDVNAGSQFSEAGWNPFYRDIGDCTEECRHCGSMFWHSERLKGTSYRRRPEYHLCCGGGKIYIQPTPDPPVIIQQLFRNRHFMEHIRAYNQMFAMTSFGAKIDHAVNRRPGPYVFKISSQVYHWIGSLCPEEGEFPRFLQMYFYDTQHEVSNRMRHFNGTDEDGLNSMIVEQLIHVLDEHNGLVQLFRTARDRCSAGYIPGFKIRLYNNGGARGYEFPTANLLGGIVFEDGPKSRNDFDVIIEIRGGPPQRINKLHKSYMSLQFPLLFIFGQPGFYPELRVGSADDRRQTRKVTMNAYYKYQLHPRVKEFGLIFRAGRLLQQYVVSVFCAIELNRLDFLRKRQRELRSDYLMGLYDAISQGDREGVDAGSMILLPRTFTGGPRYMYSHYLDALAICRSLGNPQYFVTFTCNINWPEIKRYMLGFPGLTPTDRADVVCRVFNQKVNDFVKYLHQQMPFGRVIAYLYTIEFQKRGLPHCHTLLWVDEPSKIKNAVDIDSYISAELPDPVADPIGYRVVTELMLHGPCGLANPDAPCTDNGVCSKNFPKPYNNTTFFDVNGHTHYKRRQTDVHFMKGDLRLDSTNVVPYNRELLLAFHAHINVEYCGWSMLIKYLFKYISKGPDRVLAKVSRPIGDASGSRTTQHIAVDEIKDYVDGRFVCPFEAFWRIYDYLIHRREPAVQILNVHLEFMQRVNFRATDRLNSVVNRTSSTKTTLTEWYVYNNLHTDGADLTYLDFPTRFVWYDDQKSWRRRTLKKKSSIGRLTYVHPNAGKLFYFRMLLSHQKGCKSPQDVRTINGHVFPTYRAACEAYGLLGDDREWDIALQEASYSSTSSQLRTLFVQLLIHCEVGSPRSLFDKHWSTMKDDISARVSAQTGIPNYHVNEPELQGYVLYEIESLLNGFGKSAADFGLPDPPRHLLEQLKNKLLMEEKNYARPELLQYTLAFVPKLNPDQKKIYDSVMDATARNQQQLLFVYGHGGTGKTFLWKTIISSLRSQSKIVLAVASSGIASLLLPGGRTAHSRFKLPLDLTDKSLCHAKKHSQLGNLLIETTLIVWDEAPMNDRRCFEALDRTLRDLMNSPDKLFGGKMVILGGDFRQTLPVKKGANKHELIHALIADSYLWDHFKIVTLTENMRLLGNHLSVQERERSKAFADWLLHLGNGDIGEPESEDNEDAFWVTIPQEFCISSASGGLSELINFIYDEATLAAPTASSLQEKAIVCPKNDTADTVNSLILSSIRGVEKTYLSRDEALAKGRQTSETELLYPPEYLNTIEFPGFPSHHLHLKVGAPIMMLRNVNLAGGLCNGTRMIVKSFTSKLIEAQIITGT